MNEKEINAFRATMLTGSMTAAARELNTTQPNISRLVAQLEREIGFALFHRRPNGLVPTEEGHSFYRQVERSFMGLETLKNHAQSIRRFGTRQLHIAAIPTFALSVLPKAVQHFKAEHADIGISIQTADSQTIADWIASDFCDIGLVSHLMHSPGIESGLIYTARCVCVVPQGHRLARRNKIELNDLDGEEFLSISSGSGTRKMIDAVFRNGRDDKRILSLETPFGATVCVMVGLGLGVSIVSELVARAPVQRSWMVIPFEPPLYIRSYLLRNARKATSLMAESFVECLKEILSSRQYQESAAR